MKLVRCPIFSAVRYREDPHNHLAVIHKWVKAGTWAKAG